ncbi:MAG: PAS domain-containing protein, partial [Bacteroidia bacterium]
LNDARLNEAQELAKLGNFEIDLMTNRVYYSKSAYQIYEWDEMDAIPDALRFEEMVYPADRESFSNLWKLLPERKETFEVYFRIITKSGKLKHIHTINKLERNSNGELIRIIGIISDVTERKLADDLILKNEQRLVEAQQLSKTGSFELNWDTRVLTWSLGMYAIWELDSNIEPSVNLFYSSVHPDDLVSLQQHEKLIHPTMDPWFHRYRIITPSGKVKHIDTFLKIAKSMTDDSILILGSCIDVTAAKESEEKLKFNEARLLEAQQLSKSGSWEVNLHPEFYIDWSPGTYAIWDLEQEVDVPTQENFFNRVHKDDQEKVRAVFKSLIETGAPVEVQFRVTTWANKSKVFYSKGKAIKDENGKVVKIFGTNTDVTERQNAEEKIRFSENSLLQAQRIAKLGSFYFDIEKRTFDWAEGVYYIWEKDPLSTEPSYEEILNTIHEDDKTNFIDIFNATSRSGHKQMLEFRIHVGEGKLKFIEARLRVSDYDNGKANKIFGTVVDITERKTVEQELIKARKVAEESSKAKELFLANISHELRTPLNGILGMSRLLRKSSLSSVQRNYTDVLHQTAENLLVIISEILDFTRIEEGKLTLEEVNFDPSRVADTAFNLQMFKAEEKDIVLRHKHLGNTSIPKVLGDPYRLSQVLLNLLNNAIKFTNYGEVLLTHQVIDQDSDYVEIQFTVRDTGIGIPLAHQSKIFESFTQIDSEGSKQSGVGLGLTISKNIIEKQGGRIWVESQENVGSAFHFIIKYKKAKLTLEPNRMSAIELQDLGTLNILLAEDNKVNVFITESMLTDWGFHVDVAGNGEEVLQLMEKNNYDLVLMDIQMPIMDGMETTKKIRELRDPAKSRVPVIALTANTGRQAHKQFMSLGMNDWVVKPFKEETLYRKLAMHIRGKDWLSESMKKRKFPVRKKPNVLANELLYDLSSLKSDHPSNKAFLIKMLSLFIETIPVSVENMILFFEKNQLDQVSKVAHKIKPSIEGAGILVLKECIRNVEDFSEKKRSPVQLKADLALIQKVIGEVVVAFDMEIKKLKEV